MARQFGATWWGEAWIEALENRAQLDRNRLPRGRTYARQDRVARLEIEAGKITALVRGNRALPYKVTVAVATYDDATWERLATVVAAKAAHAAALLDGVLEPEVLADAQEAGVDLLPGAGDLRPRCSCPDWADPCKHAAAVCYLVADAMDADPFVVFSMRGRTREQFLDAVRTQRRRPSAASGGADQAGPGGSGRMIAEAFGGGAVVDPGMGARDAWTRSPAPFPDRREPPRSSGTPAAWPAEPPPDAPFSAEGLTDLATDAAARAWSQLVDGAPSHLGLDVEADLSRHAAGRLRRLDSMLVLARRSGVAAAQLTRRAVAWRHAGTDGLTAIDEALWRPSPTLLEEGYDAFAEAGIERDQVAVRSNRLTVGDVQLRVSGDGRWWRYERRGRVWDLVEPPAERAADLVSTAGT